jgi:hypothetical protein
MLYTVYKVHWHFPEVCQCVQNCLHILRSLHGSLELPWSVSVYLSLSTHSTQFTLFTGTSLKCQCVQHCLDTLHSLHDSLELLWSVSVYSSLSTESTQSTQFTGTSRKCLSVYSMVYMFYTVYKFHWHFPEVCQCVQHCLHILHSLHGSLEFPWSVSVYSSLSTHSTQSTRFTGTSLKCLSVFSIVYTLYTFYTVHWNFPEVSQFIHHCLNNLHSLHVSLELPWNVSMYSALPTHSTQSTRFTGTSLKCLWRNKKYPWLTRDMRFVCRGNCYLQWDENIRWVAKHWVCNH